MVQLGLKEQIKRRIVYLGSRGIKESSSQGVKRQIESRIK